MIPSDWTAVHRADGEHVGYLSPDGGPGLIQARLLTGAPLGAPTAQEPARALLAERGLAALDRRWWCRLPDVPMSGIRPVDRPEPQWGWHPVVLVEVSPAGATVRPEFAGPGDTGRAALPVPVGDLLLPEAPA